MPTRDQFLNKLREQGYHFKRQTKRGQIFRQSGGTNYIWVPRSAKVDDDYARSALRQIGCSPADIEEFIKICNA